MWICTSVFRTDTNTAMLTIISLPQCTSIILTLREQIWQLSFQMLIARTHSFVRYLILWQYSLQILYCISTRWFQAKNRENKQTWIYVPGRTRKGTGLAYTCQSLQNSVFFSQDSHGCMHRIVKIMVIEWGRLLTSKSTWLSLKGWLEYCDDFAPST